MQWERWTPVGWYGVLDAFDTRNVVAHEMAVVAG